MHQHIYHQFPLSHAPHSGTQIDAYACYQSCYRRGILRLWTHIFYNWLQVSLPFSPERDKITVFQDCSLYQHSWKDNWKQKSQCLCFQNVQNHAPLMNCLPILLGSGPQSFFYLSLLYKLSLCRGNPISFAYSLISLFQFFSTRSFISSTITKHCSNSYNF